MLTNCYGPCMREAGSPVVSDVGTPGRTPGRRAVKADSDVFYPAYRLLNVHMHLLDVVDPRGIHSADCL